MDTKKLRQKVLDLAIHGKLVPQEGQRKTMSLKQIISLKSGEGLKVRELDESGLYPIYGGNGINGTYNTYNVEKGTLLIGRVGFYCGSIHKTISKSWVTDNALIVKINCNNIDLDFLKLTLISLNLRNTSNSTAQPVVSGKGIYPLIVEIPPLAEQHRIVKAVDELFEQIDIIERSEKELEEAANKTRDKLLNLAIQGHLVPQDPNEEPASVLLERIRAEKARLVKQGKLKKKDLEEKPISPDEIPFDIPEGWVWCRLSEIALDSADGPFGSNLKKEHYTDKREVRIIQLSNIGESGWKDANVKYTTFDYLPNIARSEAFAGDIIIAKMMPAGRAIICPDHEKKYVLSSDAVRFDFASNLDKKFLYYAINSSVFKNQVYNEVQGVTRVRTSLNKLRCYLLPIPPLSEQLRIVTKLEELLQEIDKLKA